MSRTQFPNPRGSRGLPSNSCSEGADYKYIYIYTCTYRSSTCVCGYATSTYRALMSTCVITIVACNISMSQGNFMCRCTRYSQVSHHQSPQAIVPTINRFGRPPFLTWVLGQSYDQSVFSAWLVCTAPSWGGFPLSLLQSPKGFRASKPLPAFGIFEKALYPSSSMRDNHLYVKMCPPILDFWGM